MANSQHGRSNDDTFEGECHAWLDDATGDVFYNEYARLNDEWDAVSYDHNAIYFRVLRYSDDGLFRPEYFYHAVGPENFSTGDARLSRLAGYLDDNKKTKS